jgi:uncharacterized protein (TIGR02246 family)
MIPGVFAFLIASCAPAADPLPLDESTESDVTAILELERAVFEAENAGDLEEWLSFVDDDPVWMIPNQPSLTSKEAIREWAAPYFEQYDLHEETTDREVKVCGDWGYLRAHWNWTLTPKGGGDSITDTGNSIWIVRRQPDDSWKMSQVIWNSDNPLR